jgi:hypothetical protein
VLVYLRRELSDVRILILRERITGGQKQDKQNC